MGKPRKEAQWAYIYWHKDDPYTVVPGWTARDNVLDAIRYDMHWRPDQPSAQNGSDRRRRIYGISALIARNYPEVNLYRHYTRRNDAAWSAVKDSITMVSQRVHSTKEAKAWIAEQQSRVRAGGPTTFGGRGCARAAATPRAVYAGSR